MLKDFIPRHVLFADPNKLQVKLNPQRQAISYIEPCEGGLNICLAPLDPSEKAVVIMQSEHPIRDYWWTPEGKWLILSQDHLGDENWQFSGYNLETGETKVYTPRGCQARLLQMNGTFSDKIVIALNERDKCYHDVFILDLNTGEKTGIFENHEYWDFIVDNDFQCRIGIKLGSQAGEYIDLKTGEVIFQAPQHDLFGLYFYPRLKSVFSSDNQTLYSVESNSHNTSTLVAFDLKSKGSQLLANHTEADICDVLYDPQTKTPIAYAINHVKKQWFGLQENVKSLLKSLPHDPAAEVDIIQQDKKTGDWLVSFSYSDKPTSYYYYSHTTQECDFLFLSHHHLEHYAFNAMQAIDIPMRDGVHCMSYLTLPADRHKPVPMVMVIHGGPQYRDFWGLNPFHQWLSNRGYAVLSVNYRGSTGFGRAHSEAGNGQWAGKIREDLNDAMDWAIEQGITTKDKVAILGRSFGGYQVLVGLTFTPERYCCGVDIVGPANLETMMRCFPPYWASMRAILNDVVGGDPNTEEGRQFLKAHSPLTYVDRIQRPLLMGHGMNDPRIQQAESDRMVAKMQENGVPVTYAVFSNEGHQLSHPENRKAFYGLVEAFLAKNLQATKNEPCHEGIPSTMQLKFDDFSLAEK